MGCDFCNAELYIKTVRYTKRLLAPATKEEELRQQLEDVTGEVYVPFRSFYCPICGKKKKG